MADAAVRRCAIYTRKSSEEGLEQDYNSLHAQREACEAFLGSIRLIPGIALAASTVGHRRAGLKIQDDTNP
jgi:site-specific DNA recombinase